jgi:hypothetical protein
MEDFIITEVEFDEELYKKNLEENDFSGSEIDGIGDDLDDNN